MRKAGHVMKHGNSSSPEGNNSTEPQTSVTRKVLLVEDDEDIRFLLKRYFRRMKIEVMEAGTLGEAATFLDQLDENVLVTLDLNLPDGSGFDFLSTIIAANKKCPVIVCSAYSDRAEKALELGAKEFLPKPIQFDELGEVVKPYLK
ncbi:MAG: response regulator [Flavobacteriales bacterium]|nr:response regulator [Flavobacteriales bacterium]